MTSQLGSILDAIIADLQADTTLPEPISTFHKVEGIVEGVDTTCSLWVPKQTFKSFTNDQDEADTDIHIGLGLRDMDPENAQERLRALAEEIRLVLTADDPYLGGLLDDIILSEWEFATYNASQTEVLHIAEAVWQVTYYVSRARNVTPAETMTELDFDETIDTGS